MIPKIIWTYWDKEEPPKYIKKCINTWKTYCKNDWVINVLNKKTVQTFLTELHDYPKSIWTELPAHQSDMFGVALVNKYGGVWMDSNIIMRNSINFIIKKEWFGYYYNGNAEIFLFASDKNSYTINKIHKLIFKIKKIKKTNRQRILKDKYNINAPYLFPQLLINYLINNDDKIKTIITENSVEQWNSIYILIVILNHNYKIKDKAEVLKFLMNKTGNIPEIVLKEPLLKLQGSAMQSEVQFNKNSWWFKLTNK